MTKDQIIAGLRQVQEALESIGRENVRSPLGDEPTLLEIVNQALARETSKQLPAIIAAVEALLQQQELISQFTKELQK